MKFSSAAKIVVGIGLGIAVIAGIYYVQFMKHKGSVMPSEKTGYEAKALFFSGPFKLFNKTVSSLNGAGIALLEKVVVEGPARISGTLNAVGGSFKELDMNGTATLRDTALHGQMLLNGTLLAYNTNFQDIVAFDFSKIALHNCTIKTIRIKNTEEKSISEVIELVGSTVTGDIIFEQENGQVLLKNGAQVQGAIIGGVVIEN